MSMSTQESKKNGKILNVNKSFNSRSIRLNISKYAVDDKMYVKQRKDGQFEISLNPKAGFEETKVARYIGTRGREDYYNKIPVQTNTYYTTIQKGRSSYILRPSTEEEIKKYCTKSTPNTRKPDGYLNKLLNVKLSNKILEKVKGEGDIVFTVHIKDHIYVEVSRGIGFPSGRKYVSRELSELDGVTYKPSFAYNFAVLPRKFVEYIDAYCGMKLNVSEKDGHLIISPTLKCELTGKLADAADTSFRKVEVSGQTKKSVETVSTLNLNGSDEDILFVLEKAVKAVEAKHDLVMKQISEMEARKHD